MTGPIAAYLVANARFHDTDFARLELLQLLGEDADVRTGVADSFADIDAIAKADFLITYTCDLRPTEPQQQALRDFVSAGGRWIALHGTNALLDFKPEGLVAPRTHNTFMETLGSRFISHPAMEPYQVTVSDPEHPLVKGIEPFEVSDEIYLCEYYGEIRPLLETRYTGTFHAGYIENEWPDDDPRLVAYTHPHGAVALKRGNFFRGEGSQRGCSHCPTIQNRIVSGLLKRALAGCGNTSDGRSFSAACWQRSDE